MIDMKGRRERDLKVWTNAVAESWSEHDRVGSPHESRFDTGIACSQRGRRKCERRAVTVGPRMDRCQREKEEGKRQEGWTSMLHDSIFHRPGKRQVETLYGSGPTRTRISCSRYWLNLNFLKHLFSSIASSLRQAQGKLRSHTFFTRSEGTLRTGDPSARWKKRGLFGMTPRQFRVH